MTRKLPADERACLAERLISSLDDQVDAEAELIVAGIL
jgi:hypothetical protein